VHHAKGECGAVNEPKQCTASKFGNERWGRMNNNVINFEQLDETNTPYACAVACEWPLGEASEEDK